MSEQAYDVVIVGAGPSGLTAGIYTTRRALKTLIISKDIGGQLSLTDDIENYPGFKSIGGLELAQKFQEQAAGTGSEFLFEAVTEIIKDKDGGFVVKTFTDKSIKTKTVILAFGLTPRPLDVPGEKELTGKGITYCATCDGPLYKGKDVVVIGGGNSAMDAGEFLSKITNQVYMLVRGDKLKGEKVLAQQIHDAENIEVLFGANTKEIKGKDKVEALVYTDIDGNEKELEVSGVFIEIGYIASTKWLKPLGLEMDERNQIKITVNNETNIPGIFAAGDITEITYKQAVISAGEGSKAALQAYKYIQGDKPLIPDWTPKKK
ncbi:thioredoxin reductase [Candidatus Parcubacteria bacterium]|nr:MAG: thioredoxin reductase [Candidatus Parcubacteria bacterium]